MVRKADGQPGAAHLFPSVDPARSSGQRAPEGANGHGFVVFRSFEFGHARLRNGTASPRLQQTTRHPLLVIHSHNKYMTHPE